jgi:hypothetical protein
MAIATTASLKKVSRSLPASACLLTAALASVMSAPGLSRGSVRIDRRKDDSVPISATV